MQKTLFKKYLCISMLTIFLSFLVLGSMIVFFVAKNWEHEKKDILSKNAQTIGDFVSKNSTLELDSQLLYFSPGDLRIFKGVMNTISKGMDADIFITNKLGNVLISTNESEGRCIGADIAELAMNDRYFSVSTLNGFFKSEHYVAAIPIEVITSAGEKTVVGSAFCSTSTKYYNMFLREILKIFLSAAIVTFAMVFCLVGFYTYNLVKPLHQMSEAAKDFGKGDFTKRVTAKRNDEIGQLAAAFNNMADSLAASEGTRRSFIANVSHELKTPMTTIAGFIDGILDGTVPQEKQVYYLKIVSGEIRRLSRLVQSMLALSRIDSGELHLKYQKFDISEVILNIFVTFEQKIEQRNINVSGLDNMPCINICGDRDMLYQVIYNLIENAVKFTNEGGNIDVLVFEKQNNCHVEIRNSGQGIQSEELRYIFDRFYKTDKSRSMDKNGMGLGLYIVRTIIRLHNGDITAESIVGESTLFKFYLPTDTQQ